MKYRISEPHDMIMPYASIINYYSCGGQAMPGRNEPPTLRPTPAQKVNDEKRTLFA